MGYAKFSGALRRPFLAISVKPHGGVLTPLPGEG